MIPDKVKSLFVLIDFLESNKTDYLEKYALHSNTIIQLRKEQSKLRPSKNYIERQRYDAIQKEIDKLLPLFRINVSKPIADKLLGLGIWEGDITFASIWNNNAGAVSELIENFTIEDVEEIKKYKHKYLDFRADTSAGLSLMDLTFDYLDEVLKHLFDYFKDVETNEFEAFETKTFQINNLHEAVEQFLNKGSSKFVLPNNFWDSSIVQQNERAALPLQLNNTNTIEDYPPCTSETFKTDISELCQKCPLIELIHTGIVNQVEFQAKQKKEVLTKEQFDEYMKGEIENASKAMERIHLDELQRPNDKHFRPQRMRDYIWNKERIKTLNMMWAPDKINLRKRFEREFQKANIPFREVVIKNPLFQDELFSQFCDAEVKPCFDLSLADFYSEEELKQGFEEIDKLIPVTTSKEIVAANFVSTTPFESHVREIFNEFSNKAAKKILPLKYCCPDLEKTLIAQALRAINNEYELLKKSVFDERTDKYKEAEIRSKNVIEASEGLKNFTLLILEKIQKDNENIYLYIKKADKAQLDFWRVLKSNFNNATSKILSTRSVNGDASAVSQNREAVKGKVQTAFAFMQRKDLRKHKLILNETDFENLIEWVTYYFTNEFSLPNIKEPIKEVNTNKGNVIYTFKKFFKSQYPASTYPPSLFQLYKRCFHNFRNDSEDNFKRQKEPQYYGELISKSK